jgi:hypothetical protein
VRALLVLVLAVAGFAGFLAQAHRRGADLHAAEERVLLRVREAGARGPRPPEVFLGYRLEWEPDGLLLARPLAPGDGVRWFATRDGAAVFQYDTVLFRARDEGPDPQPLRAWLASGKGPPSLPPGWAPVD